MVLTIIHLCDFSNISKFFLPIVKKIREFLGRLLVIKLASIKLEASNQESDGVFFQAGLCNW